MKARLTAALITLLAMPAGAAEPLRESRADLLSQSPAEVARTLLGDLADRFVTMAADPENHHDYQRSVSLATNPEGTGIEGLCQAKVLQIWLADSNGHGATSTIAGFNMSDVYKVIGVVDGPLGPHDPTERQQARLCANVGPVVVPYRDNHGAQFFHYSGYGEPWLGVVALQELIQGAHDGDYSGIECERREINDCRDPRAELGALDLRSLKSIEVIQPDPMQPNFRVRAVFVAEPGAQLSAGREVRFDFNGEPLPVQRSSRHSFSSFRYSAVKLSRAL